MTAGRRAQKTAGGRALGVDVGTVRAGVAVSDPAGLIASPRGTVEGGAGLAERVAALARDEGATTIVVGLPRALSGRETASTAMARTVAAQLKAAGLEVVLWDERLTSVQAERTLVAAGRRRAQRRGERDRVAAALILQSWLDAAS